MDPMCSRVEQLIRNVRRLEMPGPRRFLTDQAKGEHLKVSEEIKKVWGLVPGLKCSYPYVQVNLLAHLDLFPDRIIDEGC